MNDSATGEPTGDDTGRDDPRRDDPRGDDPRGDDTARGRDERPTHRWWMGVAPAAFMTALSTVLVAVAAFLSAQAASNSDDSYATATLALTDANFFFEQFVFATMDDVEEAGLDDDRICVVALFSVAAESVCEPSDELRELVGEGRLAQEAAVFQETADAAFEDGLEWSKRSVAYQAALVMFAVGLAMSAWASLSDTNARVRPAFLSLALIAILAGLVRLVTV